MEPLATERVNSNRPTEEADLDTALTDLRQIFKFLATKATIQETDSTECPICLGTLLVPNSATSAHDEFRKCSMNKPHHIFHRQCFKEWAKSNPTCPVCREPLSDYPVDENFDGNETALILLNNFRYVTCKDDNHRVTKFLHEFLGNEVYTISYVLRNENLDAILGFLKSIKNDYNIDELNKYIDDAISMKFDPKTLLLSDKLEVLSKEDVKRAVETYIEQSKTKIEDLFHRILVENPTTAIAKKLQVLIYLFTICDLNEIESIFVNVRLSLSDFIKELASEDILNIHQTLVISSKTSFEVKANLFLVILNILVDRGPTFIEFKTCEKITHICLNYLDELNKSKAFSDLALQLFFTLTKFMFTRNVIQFYLTEFENNSNIILPNILKSPSEEIFDAASSEKSKLNSETIYEKYILRFDNDYIAFDVLRSRKEITDRIYFFKCSEDFIVLGIKDNNLKVLNEYNYNANKKRRDGINIIKETEQMITFEDLNTKIDIDFCGEVIQIDDVNLLKCVDKCKIHISGVVNQLPEYMFYGLYNLKDIYLNSKTLTVLEPNIFKNLDNLIVLNLSSNQLENLPQSTFKGLCYLEQLDISKNLLTTLPVGILSDLKNIIHLDLSGNGLTELTENIFNGLRNLENLNLSSNEIDNLPPTIFSGLRNIRVLELNSNKLNELNENLFNGLSILENLKISNNLLTTLPSNIFKGLTNIKILELNKNKLTESNENLFNGLSCLENLKISNNLLTTLPPRIFRGLTNIKLLDLNENKLAELNENIFNGLKNLQNLNLSSNELVDLPLNIFNGLNYLKKLNISKNVLTKLSPYIFWGVGNVQVLDLHKNKIVDFASNTFCGLSSLKNLNISYNSLTVLPKSLFSGLKNLKVLDLRDIEIDELCALHGLGNLRELFLPYQLKKNYDYALDGLNKLECLLISFRDFMSLSKDGLKAIDNLKCLFLYPRSTYNYTFEQFKARVPKGCDFQFV